MKPIHSLLLFAPLLLLPGSSASGSATDSPTAPVAVSGDRSRTVLKDPPLITAKALRGVVLLEIRAEDQLGTKATGRHYTRDEIALVEAFVNNGGSLLVVIDEERRTPLYADGAEALIAPFGMRFTPDTVYLHNCGGIAKAGTILKADREIPYSGGRAVEGGVPFAWRLDAKGDPAEPFAAYVETKGGGRVVALAEAMAYIGMGMSNGVRLSGVPHQVQGTLYWGKDSKPFMDEVRVWLADNAAAKHAVPSCAGK